MWPQECEKALSAVMPPLLKALKGLRAIDKSSIAELKVMRNPPAGASVQRARRTSRRNGLCGMPF